MMVYHSQVQTSTIAPTDIAAVVSQPAMFRNKPFVRVPIIFRLLAISMTRTKIGGDRGSKHASEAELIQRIEEFRRILKDAKRPGLEECLCTCPATQ